MGKTPDLKGALDAMDSTSRGRTKKSPVYRWLSANHAGLVEAFRRRPPSWTALAKYLGEGGVMNADGNPPSPSAVRSSWGRLEADLARKKGRKSLSAARVDDFEPEQPATEYDFNRFVKER